MDGSVDGDQLLSSSAMAMVTAVMMDSSRHGNDESLLLSVVEVRGMEDGRLLISSKRTC